MLKGNVEYIEQDFTAVVAEIEDKGVAIFFHYIDDETSTMEASITDNYVESNHSVQDHIAIKPRIYRLRGCVGEVVYEGGSAWLEALSDKISQNPILSKTMNAMKPIGAIAGVFGNSTKTAMAIVKQLESSYNRYRKMIEDNILSSTKRKLLNKKQETTVAYLNRILELRVPVSLKGTKFEYTLDKDSKDNQFKRIYYLQSVSAHQGSNNYITDIEVTIKEFRIATTKVTKLDPNKYGGVVISNVEQQPEVNAGQAKGQKVQEKTKTTIKETVKEKLQNHPKVYNWVSDKYHKIKNDINQSGIFNAQSWKISKIEKTGTGNKGYNIYRNN